MESFVFLGAAFPPVAFAAAVFAGAFFTGVAFAGVRFASTDSATILFKGTAFTVVQGFFKVV